MGCFGEALVRKFGEEPPEEWALAIGSLDARQIARGLRRVVYGWKGPPPNLPDFMRLCRSIGDDGEFEPEPTPPRPVIEGPQCDDWELTANRHLLAHILKHLGKFSVEQVHEMVRGKKLWAQDMRDLGGKNIDPELQKACWQDYVGKIVPTTSGSPTRS